MDIIKDILSSWIKGILSIVVPVLLVIILSLIIFNTGNPYGRYIDSEDFNEVEYR
jgi:hypothetical protein